MEPIQLSRDDARKQWKLLEDEYTLEGEDETTKDDHSSALNKIKSALIRAVMAGWIEIIEDAKDGVIVRQFIRHPPDGFPESLTYVAPNASHIASAGIGRDIETANNMRYMRLAASLTGQMETKMSLLKGGDRSRMETIASLFLLV